MKIICIGRNYTNHAKELGNPVPSSPIFFMKPDTALLSKNNPFVYPEFSNEIHYEVEVVVKICKRGKYIDRKFAKNYYNELTVGIDFTARDVQEECKKMGLPWEKAKSFDGSGPIGQFVPVSNFNSVDDINFSLTINDEVKQLGNTKNMLFSIDELIAHVSQYTTLKIGDLLFTGTPAGVGEVFPGDKLIASIEEAPLLNLKIK